MIDFTTFFDAIYERPPFPWQRMLAEQVLAKGRWPRLIDLPTASGKTACIDVAVWAMACEADKPPQERTMPRRIWFVVDRRIVVDEAAGRAEKIQKALIDAEKGSDLAQVRDALFELAGTKQTPLAVARLRGGSVAPPCETDVERKKRLTAEAINDSWQTVPTQPAVLTSTVDQLGSRLLFRGYGMSPNRWPIHAALAGNDSLILLDEAHVAEPLRQTLRWVERHRRRGKSPVATPWHFAFMTATPGKVDEADEWPKFPAAAEREAALNNDLLKRRRESSKPATLVTVDTGKSREDAKIAAEVLKQVAGLVKNRGRRRVAVMLNRVDTAVATAKLLADKLKDAQTNLLTGRMRPIDRADLIGDLGKVFAAGVTDDGSGPPRVLVTTQCLEVGADFDFDALVSECASLDALRQRFGRLDRLGDRGTSGPVPAAILTCAADLKTDESGDPIYGIALAKTHGWLHKFASDGAVDFGIDALDALLREHPPAESLLSPKPDAPVLMTAYLDAWCQTAPRPAAEAEVSLFLHGTRDDMAEVGVVFRSDLDGLDEESMAEVVRLCPPRRGEVLTARLGRLRAWLGKILPPADADVAGTGGEKRPIGKPKCVVTPPEKIVRYGGGPRVKVEVLSADAKLRPGDLLVVPLDCDEIPDVLGSKGYEDTLDRFEDAYVGGSPILRITPPILRQHKQDETLAADARTRAEVLQRGLDEVEYDQDEEAEAKSDARARLRKIVVQAWPEADAWPPDAPFDWHVHPAGGVIIVGPTSTDRPPPVDPFAEPDDLLHPDLTVPEACRKLAYHAHRVTMFAGVFSSRLLPAEMRRVYESAGRHHDDGKADRRFQAWLRGDRYADLVPGDDELLAKSDAAKEPLTPSQVHDVLGVPRRFRHEMLSLPLMQSRDPAASDLLLHLIAAHHGYARPFAPVILDDDPPDVEIDGASVFADERKKNPPYRLGSGVAERFWKLTRRHGWWGLAYLETVLRLADQHASRFPVDPKEAANA